MTSIRITGDKEVTRVLLGLSSQVKRETGNFVAIETAILAAKVKQAAPEATPFLPQENLRESIETVRSQRGDSYQGQVQVNAVYAARTHENPRTGNTGGFSPSGERYYRWSRVGGPKFAEGPLLEQADQYGNRFAGHLGRRVFR